MGPLHTSSAAIPEMRRRGSGRIINISSIGGKIPVAHLVPYSAGKFALVGLSEGMRAELLKDNIVVTTVVPGLMRTGSIYNAFFKGRNREEFAWFAILDSLPLISMSANKAARIILRGARMGRAEITPSVFAKLGSRIHGLLPGLTTDLMGLVGRLLPKPNGAGTRRVRGRDSQTRLSSSILTILNQRAAQGPEPARAGPGRGADRADGPGRSTGRRSGGAGGSSGPVWTGGSSRPVWTGRPAGAGEGGSDPEARSRSRRPVGLAAVPDWLTHNLRCAVGTIRGTLRSSCAVRVSS